MRFMMMVIPKGYQSAAPDTVPIGEAEARMLEYNKALQKAGVLLALDGLFPPSSGARVSYTDGKPTVTDGSFAESKEGIGGYWIIQVRSREEAIEWARRAPMCDNEVIEIRQIQEMPELARTQPVTPSEVEGPAWVGRAGRASGIDTNTMSDAPPEPQAPRLRSG